MRSAGLSKEASVVSCGTKRGERRPAESGWVDVCTAAILRGADAWSSTLHDVDVWAEALLAGDGVCEREDVERDPADPMRHSRFRLGSDDPCP